MQAKSRVSRYNPRAALSKSTSRSVAAACPWWAALFHALYFFAMYFFHLSLLRRLWNVRSFLGSAFVLTSLLV